MHRIDDELERGELTRELGVLMHQRAEAVGVGAEWRDDADGSVIALLDDQLAYRLHDRLGFRDVERAASGRAYDLPADVDPTHGGAGGLRTLEVFMIGGDAEAAAIEVPVGERNDV